MFFKKLTRKGENYERQKILVGNAGNDTGVWNDGYWVRARRGR